jgi:glycosyltransferase involved in cell wall biosynthesis
MNRAMHSDRPISVCALVPYSPDTTPSQRFRIEQWTPELKAQGIEIELMPFADDRLMKVLHQPGRQAAKAAALTGAFARRLGHLARVRRFDVVFIHRAACIAGPALFERALRLFRRPLIFDFDDAIFLLHTTEANRRFGWLKFPGKTASICRLSDHVVVGNSYLGEYAGQYNSHVTVIPTSVDTERYRPVPKSGAQGRIIVGWTGSSMSQTYLEMFAPVLSELVGRYHIELRIHSDRRPILPDIPFVWRPWSAETEVEEMAQFDIGIMPMPDDMWARGKCAMKALLYMALGIPALCSAIGANCEVIQHDENGLLASTPEEWLGHFESLIDDPNLRARLGSAGRRTIEERYSMRRCAGLFADVVREVSGRGSELQKAERLYQPAQSNTD